MMRTKEMEKWTRSGNAWRSTYWTINCDKVITGSVLGWLTHRPTGRLYEFCVQTKKDLVVWEKEPHRGGPQYVVDRIVDTAKVFMEEQKTPKKRGKKKGKKKLPEDTFSAELHCPHCGVELNTHPAGSDGDYLMRCTSCDEDFYIDAQKVEYYTFTTRKA